MGGDMDVKEAIRTGDAEALRRLLTEDASRANALIRWGKNGCVLTHPLHFRFGYAVCGHSAERQ
jgi:hypothetical protein